MRAQVPEHAGGGEIREFAPGIWLGVKPEAVEASLIFDDRAQRACVDKLLDRQKSSVPPAILINGEQTSALCREARQLFCLGKGWSEGLVDDHIAASFEAGLCVGEVRIVWSGDDAEADRFVGKHLVEVSRDAHVGISFFRFGTVALEDAGQLHAGNAANDGRVERLSCQTETDEPYSNHG